MSVSQRHSRTVVLKGFSLLEILVVLGMAGILVSLAISNFRFGVGNPGLSSQVQEVQAVFDAARSHAVKTNTPTCVALRTEYPTASNQNQCSTVVEYYYSLSRAGTLECDIFGGQGSNAGDIQFHRKKVNGLAYTILGVPPFATVDDSQNI